MFDRESNLCAKNQAVILNASPRPGLVETGAEGSDLFGTFVSDGDGWSFLSEEHGASRFGYGCPLETIESILAQWRSEFPEAGAIGYVAYEFGETCLGLHSLRDDDDIMQVPQIVLLFFKRLYHPEAGTHRSIFSGHRSLAWGDLDRLMGVGDVRACTSKTRYTEDVLTIKELIAQGQIYQANYTQAFEMRSPFGAEVNWQRLRSRASAPYTTFLRVSGCEIPSRNGPTKRYPPFAVMSASPERFWRKRGNRVDSRPIKGTIGRGKDTQDDRRRRRELLRSAKDRAELLMITDLVRNDLGRVADIGTVRTDSLVRVHSTPSVWHLESTVTAGLPPRCSWIDVMKALHPAGSITGAPKRRAVEIIRKLEPVPRGPYCGAIGWVDANGNADFAVGIRACVQIGDTIRLHAGGGIVADSDPEAEYYESLIKIAPLIEALTSPEIVTSRTEHTGAQLHA